MTPYEHVKCNGCGLNIAMETVDMRYYRLSGQSFSCPHCQCMQQLGTTGSSQEMLREYRFARRMGEHNFNLFSDEMTRHRAVENELAKLRRSVEAELAKLRRSNASLRGHITRLKREVRRCDGWWTCDQCGQEKRPEDETYARGEDHVVCRDCDTQLEREQKEGE